MLKKKEEQKIVSNPFLTKNPEPAINSLFSIPTWWVARVAQNSFFFVYYTFVVQQLIP